MVNRDLLRVEHVSKYYGQFLALDDVSFQVQQGEILGLLGPNGAGKTTLFNCLTGFDSVQSGHFLFQGKVMSSSPVSVVRSGIMRTFQNVRLFPTMTVLENILMGAYVQRHRYSDAQWRDKALALLEKVGLQDSLDHTVLSLSYGQRRYVEIARALLADPILLAMDEPAAGLNNKETAALCQWIREISASGMTIVLIEHDMSMMMRLCDRMVVLNYGRLIATGSPEDIKAHPEVIAAYLGSRHV